MLMLKFKFCPFFLEHKSGSPHFWNPHLFKILFQLFQLYMISLYHMIFIIIFIIIKDSKYYFSCFSGSVFSWLLRLMRTVRIYLIQIDTRSKSCLLFRSLSVRDANCANANAKIARDGEQQWWVHYLAPNVTWLELRPLDYSNAWNWWNTRIIQILTCEVIERLLIIPESYPVSSRIISRTLNWNFFSFFSTFFDWV